MNRPTQPPRLRISLLLLSTAGLAFEINLTRLFSVAQFYHFAFMIVSIALLGYGASGAALALRPGLGRSDLGRSLTRLALATAVSILGCYLLINRLPFDSFSIAWETRQVYRLVLHYAALALPFFFSGMAVGLLLADDPGSSGQTYAANLLGSALGCLLALAGPPFFGGEGTVALSSGLAALAGLAAAWEPGRRRAGPALAAAALALAALAALAGRFAGSPAFAWLDLRLSPYKSLSYALQVPGAQVTYRRWNAFSRVDAVRSPAIHTYPGLSYRYLEPLPAQDGLTVDGDDLLPVVSPSQPAAFTGHLPAAVAFRLRPAARALLLEPRGGLDILTALAQGASQVTAVEMNPLIVAAAGDIYRHPRLRLVIETDRSYLRRSAERFDVIVLSLVSGYHPVRSGAYSLAEDYRYTVEAFDDALRRLEPGGVFAATRWLQMPPSEELRLFALAVTAVERQGGEPRAQIAVLRGYNTATLLVKNGAFTPGELDRVRAFAAERAFDLVYAPGMQPQEANRYNVLPEPVYFQAFSALLDSRPREAFYAAYPYDVAPPSDDRPFFGHFFKWSQAGEVLSELGKVWQPFGGAGYFVVLALLLLAVIMAALLILLPAAALRRPAPAGAAAPAPPAARTLAYFALIGLAFMLVEIPLIQRFILFLGQPAYALTAVLFALLSFSALGSRWSSRLPLPAALGGLALLLLAAPWLLPWIFRQALGLALELRLAVTALAIAPAGFLMGIPFPGGIRRLAGASSPPGQVAWIWAANGAASVVSSVLAALLALSFGFDWVLRLGALAYAAAGLLLTARRSAPAGDPH